jgi:hypothetical protein
MQHGCKFEKEKNGETENLKQIHYLKDLHVDGRKKKGRFALVLD